VVVSTQTLITAKRKIIIGADYEEELSGWTQLLRGGLDDDKTLVASDHEGWLFKKNATGIAWWKLRWFTLSGTTLKYYDSEKEHEAGEVDLTKYTVHFPSLEGMDGLERLEHRTFEIALIPCQSESSDDDTMRRVVSKEREPDRPLLLAADDETSFAAWKAVLSSVCQLHVASTNDDSEWEVVADDGSGRTTTLTQAELVESITPTGQAVDSQDIGVSVQHFDQLSVLGKGGFGKVLLVRKCDTKQQFAMKILLKSFIIDKGEVCAIVSCELRRIVMSANSSSVGCVRADIRLHMTGRTHARRARYLEGSRSSVPRMGISSHSSRETAH
jgi:hypothetical protein